MLDKLKQPQRAIQVSGNVPIYHRYTLGVAGSGSLKPSGPTADFGLAMPPVPRPLVAAQDVL